MGVMRYLALICWGVATFGNGFAILRNYTSPLLRNSSVFWNNVGDEEVARKCDKAESQLRLYIYPIPAGAARANTESSILAHFMLEVGFFRYLLKQQKHVTVTSDPSNANAFFIEHHMIHLSAQSGVGDRGCADIEQHLRLIVDNVIIAQPYYNRSGGRDHFFFSVYDHGPFCEHVCQGDKTHSASITNTLERLSGLNFIGNFGMDDAKGDKGYHQSWSHKGTLCHRIGQDIVIPQIINHQLLQFRKRFPYTGVLERPFDSSFAGSYWGERAPMLGDMAKYRIVDYHVNKTENFFFDITGGSADVTITQKSLYMYHVCGYACWSNRLFHAMGVSTVPLIVSTGVVQAFERFIDWRKISTKMSLETWKSPTKRTAWRAKHLRTHVDKYHAALADFYTSWGLEALSDPKFQSFGTSANPIPDIEHVLSMYDNEYRMDKKENNTAFLLLAQTNIWQKKIHMEQAIRWFDFSLNLDEFASNRINAYRLLFFEIWCRVGPRQEVQEEFFCNNNASHIARIEYE